jgi:saccharopine dehydrogenase (NAD+, L-lysine-forming)
MDTVGLGICTEEPLNVQGREVIPIEFAVAYIISRRPGFIEAAGLTEPTGCLKVEVKGKKDGDAHTYVFSMFSKGAGAGEGTGIPAALGAIMMKQGQITEKGVYPPEAGVESAKMLELAGQVLKGTGMGEGGVPIFIEHIDKDGKAESIDFRL